MEVVSTDSAGLETGQPIATGVESVVAEVRLDHEALVGTQTLRRLSDVRLVPEYRASGGDRPYLFLGVVTGDFDRFERELDADPTVEEPILVDRFVDRRVYRVTVTEFAIPVDETVASVGGRIVESVGTPSGWTIQTRFPSRESLVAFNRECNRRDVAVSVIHLRAAEPDASAQLGLTDKQQQLLTMAHEAGYFDVPRGISQDELATRLGVSKSAISQRMRRAMGELCETTLIDP